MKSSLSSYRVDDFFICLFNEVTDFILLSLFSAKNHDSLESFLLERETLCVVVGLFSFREVEVNSLKGFLDERLNMLKEHLDSFKRSMSTLFTGFYWNETFIVLL